MRSDFWLSRIFASGVYQESSMDNAKIGLFEWF